MIKLTYYKVVSLPSSPAPNSVYFVENGDKAEAYITSETGVAKAMTNTAVIQALIAASLEDLPLPEGAVSEDRVGELINEAISALPTPSEPITTTVVKDMIDEAIEAIPAPPAGLSENRVAEMITAAFAAYQANPSLPTLFINVLSVDDVLTEIESRTLVISGITSAANGSVVTVKIGSTTLGTATAASGAWSLAAQNLSSYAGTGQKVITATVSTVSTTRTITIEAAVYVPPTVSITAIGGDNNITAIEAASIAISGTTSAANGATVTVKIGTTTLGTTTVASGAWSLTAQNLTSYATGSVYTVSAQIAETTATAQLTINAPIVVPPTISISAIGGDNDLTAVEAASVTISGVSNAANSSTVTVLIGSTTLGMTVVNSGAWSLTGIDLTPYADATSRTVSAVVGGVTATASLIVRAPVVVPPTISITDIGGDNDITAVEAAAITISGVTTAANGATVAISVDATSIGSATVSGGTWSLANANLTSFANGSSHTVFAVVGGVTATKAVTVRSAVVTPTLPAPLTGINEIVLIGASIEAGIVDTYATIMSDYMKAKHGLTVTITKYGYTGASIETVADNWTSTIMPAYSGRTDVLIMTMPLGNTITTYVPFATAASASLAVRKTRYSDMIASMKATVGARNVMVVNHTFRNYAPDGSCITDETLGSLPFNENWVYPEAQATDWWYEGRPWADPYNIAFNNYANVLIDSTHYTSLGYQMLAMYWLDCAAAAIKGVAPPRIPKASGTPIGVQTPKDKKAMIIYRGTSILARSSTLLIGTARGYNYTGAAAYLAGMDSYEPTFGFLARANALTSGTQTGLGTGNTTNTLLNDTLRLSYNFTNSATFVPLETITNCVPGKSYKIGILSCRSLASGTRIGEFTFNGGTTIYEIDGACVPGNTPNTMSVTVVADSNGQIPIQFRCKSGNTSGAYINALTIEAA